VSESHVVLANTGEPETEVQIASAWGANWSIGPSRVPIGRTSYLTTWAHGEAVESALYHGRGGFGTWVSVPTGCGVGLGSAGVPSLGAPISLLVSFPVSATIVCIGPPLATPIPVCSGCSLGFDPALALTAIVPLVQLNLVIPGDPGLLGARVAFQAIDFEAGGCPQGYRLSDTLIATID
jgi:hypothetical protein